MRQVCLRPSKGRKREHEHIPQKDTISDLLVQAARISLFFFKSNLRQTLIQKCACGNVLK